MDAKAIFKSFDPEAKITKGYSGSGVMIALPIPTSIAQAFGKRAVPDDEMHVTLAYLGRVENVDPDAIKRAMEIVKDVALDFRPLKARIGGHGRFVASESSDGKDVMYASYDAPMLADLRQAIVVELRAAGVPLKGLAHGFTPHITTDYLEKGQQIDPPTIPEVDFETDMVCFYIGDQKIEIPFGGENSEQLEPDQPAPLAGDLGPADAMALKMFKLDLIEKEGEELHQIRKVSIVTKGDGWEQLVYGVVSEPDDIDADDQVQTAYDIKFAAHHFLGVQGITGYRHREPADATVVESYIAPCDFEMGGQKVLAGSWVLVTRVNDEALWNEILAGNITAYSVGGFGVTVPLAG